MKNLLSFLAFCIALVTSSVVETNGQTFEKIQQCTSSCTLADSATVVYVTGTGPYTVSLGIKYDNRSVTIVNHTQNDLTISPAIRVRRTTGSYTSSSILPANNSE